MFGSPIILPYKLNEEEPPDDNDVVNAKGEYSFEG